MESLSSLVMIEINNCDKVIVSANCLEAGSSRASAININVTPTNFALVCENTASGAFSAVAIASGGVTWTNWNNILF